MKTEKGTIRKEWEDASGFCVKDTLIIDLESSDIPIRKVGFLGFWEGWIVKCPECGQEVKCTKDIDDDEG